MVVSTETIDMEIADAPCPRAVDPKTRWISLFGTETSLLPMPMWQNDEISSHSSLQFEALHDGPSILLHRELERQGNGLVGGGVLDTRDRRQPDQETGREPPVAAQRARSWL